MPHSTTMTRSTASRVVTGALAGAALLAVIVGIPVALALLGGDPLPHHVPTGAGVRDTLLHKDVTGSVFIDVIIVVGWLAWASFALSIVVEVVARLRGRTAVRLPGLGGPQRFAAGMIAAVALGLASPASALAAPHAPVAAVATPAPDHAPSAAHARPVVADGVTAATGTQVSPEAASHDAHLVYQVRKGDYLGRIAERFGGSFESATEIAHANHIKDPNLIDIGWRITLPDDAVDSGAHRHATGHLVEPPDVKGHGDGEAVRHPGPIEPSEAASPTAAASHETPPEAAPQPPSGVPSAAKRVPGTAPQPPVFEPPLVAPPAVSTSDTAHSHASDGAAAEGGAPEEVQHRSPGGSVAGDAGPVAADAPSVGVVGELLAASGTLAAVVSLAVVVMRRRDEAAQRLGQVSAPPASGGDVPRLMAPTAVQDVVRLDRALRVLSDRVADWPVDAIPQIAGVWLDHGAVTLLLADEGRDAPEPFVDDANGWRLDAETSIAEPADQIAPLPLLCAAGGRDRQHALLDLEYLRVLGIGGDPVEAMNLMRFIVAELCHNVWADDIRVTLAGFGPEAAVLSGFDPVRLRVEPSIATAVAAFHGRLADAVANLHDVRPPDVLLVASPSIGDHTALAALEHDLMATPGVGMAVVVAPTPEGLPVGRYQMNVGGGGDLHIGFLGDALMPAATLPSALVGEVVSLIAEARETGDPSPLDLARVASRAAIVRVPGGRAMQFAGQRRQDPGQRSFRAELDDLTRGRPVRHAGMT